MTYKIRCHSYLSCLLKRAIRRVRWVKISRPLSSMVWDNSAAITKHFGERY